jgi:hypothetical protein
MLRNTFRNFFAESGSLRSRPLASMELLEARKLLSAAAPYVPGELLVTFKPGVSQEGVADFYGKNGFTERQALDRYAKPNASHLKLVSVPAAQATDLIPLLRRPAWAGPRRRRCCRSWARPFPGPAAAALYRRAPSLRVGAAAVPSSVHPPGPRLA